MSSDKDMHSVWRETLCTCCSYYDAADALVCCNGMNLLLQFDDEKSVWTVCGTRDCN